MHNIDDQPITASQLQNLSCPQCAMALLSLSGKLQPGGAWFALRQASRDGPIPSSESPASAFAQQRSRKPQLMGFDNTKKFKLI